MMLKTIQLLLGFFLFLFLLPIIIINVPISTSQDDTTDELPLAYASANLTNETPYEPIIELEPETK